MQRIFVILFIKQMVSGLLLFTTHMDRIIFERNFTTQNSSVQAVKLCNLRKAMYK